MEDIVFLSKRSHFKADPAREEKWLRESQRALERRRQGKAPNRRSAIGKPFGWPLELFSRDLPAGSEQAVPEPDPAKPDKRLKVAPQNDPLSRFREFMNAAPKRPKRPQEDRDKAIMTEDTTVVGDNDAHDMAEEEIYERIDEDDVPEQTFSFDYQKVEEEAETRKELAKLRRDSDSHLRDQVFDSCALQGERGLARELGELFPWMVDEGFDQPAHVFWHGEDVCPQILEHWASNEYRPDKLFVPVDRSNTSFMEVIRMMKEVDEYSADRKRACAAYFCCFAVFYGQKPKQCAHVEHTCFRHDLDKRIVEKQHYDHAEDFKYDNSMNTFKKLLGYEKDGGKEGQDEVGAYLHAWKRLAKEGRWWFVDKFTGIEWIAVPWFWKHTEPTESTYHNHFARCFAEEHHSIYVSRPKPEEFRPDPEAVFEIKASVLARKSACLHTPRRSFQEVAEIVWRVQFRETPDEAKRLHDQAVQDLEALQKESMFAQELPGEILEKKGRLTAACRQYLERSGLVHRVASIIFERQPKRSKPVSGELEVLDKEKAQAHLEAAKAAERERWADRSEIRNNTRKIENLSEEQQTKIREQTKARQAKFKQKAAEKKAAKKTVSGKLL